jgi:hypothetical protein
MDRYSKIPVLINKNDLYKNFLKDRNIKQINHFSSITYNYPTIEQLQELQFETYIWKSGDRYWKLASRYYNDPTLWWIIAYINKKPIESDLAVGDSLFIPLDVESLLRLIEG